MCGNTCPIIWKDKDCIRALHIAYQYGLDASIPAALYKCACHLSAIDLFAATSGQTTNPNALTSQQLLNCMRTREILLKGSVHIYEILASGIESITCAHTNLMGEELPCSKAMRLMACDSRMAYIIRGCDALCPLNDWVTGWAESDEEPTLCESCSHDLQDAITAVQRRIWSSLGTTICSTSVSCPRSYPSLNYL